MFGPYLIQKAVGYTDQRASSVSKKLLKAFQNSAVKVPEGSSGCGSEMMSLIVSLKYLVQNDFIVTGKNSFKKSEMQLVCQISAPIME